MKICVHFVDSKIIDIDPVNLDLIAQYRNEMLSSKQKIKHKDYYEELKKLWRNAEEKTNGQLLSIWDENGAWLMGE